MRLKSIKTQLVSEASCVAGLAGGRVEEGMLSTDNGHLALILRNGQGSSHIRT